MNASIRFSLVCFSLFLAGCPQGAAGDVFGRDGGDDDDAGDAAADAAADVVAERNDGGGSGALCGVDGKNECGSLAVCDEKLGCVECRGDKDCPLAAAHCLLGACVGCRPKMSDCPDGQACSTDDFECHPRCTGPASCGGPTVCDESSGECVGCLSKEGCAGLECSPEKRQCVECTSDDACPKSKPRCRIITGECVRCRSNDDCGIAAPVCDPATFTCVSGKNPVSDAGAIDGGRD